MIIAGHNQKNVLSKIYIFYGYKFFYIFWDFQVFYDHRNWINWLIYAKSNNV